MSASPTCVQVLLPSGGVVQTLFLYETENSVFTRYGCFRKPELTWVRDPSVKILVDSPELA